MTEEVHIAEVLCPRRMLGYILGMTALSALVASWFVWGPFGIIFYVDGLFNSTWAFVFAPLLFLLIPAAAVLLPVRAVWTAWHWRSLTHIERWYGIVSVAVLFAFVLSSGLGFTGMQPSVSDMFARGFARHVQSKTDIVAIQDWLNALDPNICRNEGGYMQDRRLGASEQPACVAHLKPKWATIWPEDGGRLMLRLGWGGGLIGHWGVAVGHRDMPIPPSDTSNFGESRFPLAPGAYVWSGD